MTIHVLTSYKGGVGKTSIALSIAGYCVKHGKNFTLIDTNPQNSNIAEDIFFYFHVDRLKGNSCFKSTHDQTVSNFGVIYTLAPDSDVTFTVINATGQNPFEIAHHIQSASKEEDHVYIIDTNVHVRSYPDELTVEKRMHSIYVWFLWGWSSPRLTHQLEAILESSRSLEDTWPNTQMIHVFNLYDFFTGGLGGFSFRKANTTLKPLKLILKKLDKKLKRFDKNKCSSVYIDHKTLTEFAKDMHTTLIGYVAGDNLSMEELPALWSEHLSALIEKSNEDYPYNMLIIPTFFRELTMSTDRIIMSSPRSFEKILSQIRPMSEFIDTFLYALDKCVVVEKASNNDV